MAPRSDPPEKPVEYISIGLIGRPSGLGGANHAEAFGESLGRLRTPLKVRVGEDPVRSEEIVLAKVVRREKDHICFFRDIDTREKAQTLTRKLIFVPQDKLPALPGDQHYHFELKGLRAISAETGAEIGTVVEVHNYPSVDALEVKRADGTDVLVPMTKEIVVEVDKKAGAVRIDDRALADLIG